MNAAHVRPNFCDHRYAKVLALERRRQTGNRIVGHAIIAAHTPEAALEVDVLNRSVYANRAGRQFGRSGRATGERRHHDHRSKKGNSGIPHSSIVKLERERRR